MAEIECRLLGPGDLDALLAAPGDLFDNPVDAAQAAAFLADPGHLIVFGCIRGEVAGFASATMLLHPDKPPACLVNEVGTRERFRRRGVARAVCALLFNAARARGCKGIWLATEPDNAAALGLYRTLCGDEAGLVGFGWDGALDD